MKIAFSFYLLFYFYKESLQRSPTITTIPEILKGISGCVVPQIILTIGALFVGTGCFFLFGLIYIHVSFL